MTFLHETEKMFNRMSETKKVNSDREKVFPQDNQGLLRSSLGLMDMLSKSRTRIKNLFKGLQCRAGTVTSSACH